MTPEERASDLTKWVAADLRPGQWAAIRNSFVEALAEEREVCAQMAEAAAASYAGNPADLKAIGAFIATAIRSGSAHR
jgi:hypothetical protein